MKTSSEALNQMPTTSPPRVPNRSNQWLEWNSVMSRTSGWRVNVGAEVYRTARQGEALRLAWVEALGGRSLSRRREQETGEGFHSCLPVCCTPSWVEPSVRVVRTSIHSKGPIPGTRGAPNTIPSTLAATEVVVVVVVVDVAV